MGLPAGLPAGAARCCWLLLLLLLLCVAGAFALWTGPLDLIMILLLSFICEGRREEECYGFFSPDSLQGESRAGGRVSTRPAGLPHPCGAIS